MGGPNPILLVSLWAEEIRVHTREGSPGEMQSVKTAIYKARTEASEETNPADTLILDFQPPEL